MTICSVCNGTGKQHFPVLSEEDGELKQIDVPINCAKCKGSGRIEKEGE